MALKQFKPTSPGRRGMTGFTFEEITKKRPERRLVVARKQKAGRKQEGRVTVRHRGGGAKRHLRIIDFKRDTPGVPGKVAAIEYDPNRPARIALIHYRDGDKRYILAPQGLQVDDVISSRPEAEVRTGKALPPANIAPGPPGLRPAPAPPPPRRGRSQGPHRHARPQDPVGQASHGPAHQGEEALGQA